MHTTVKMHSEMHSEMLYYKTVQKTTKTQKQNVNLLKL